MNQLKNLNITQQVHMSAPVNYLLNPFEGNINHGDPKGLKIYLKAKEEIDKEADKVDISVSNPKDII